jgi:hypothetical protein
MHLANIYMIKHEPLNTPEVESNRFLKSHTYTQILFIN